jgi:hypothetical protein
MVWLGDKRRDGRLCMCLARTSWSIQSPGPPIRFFSARFDAFPNSYTCAAPTRKQDSAAWLDMIGDKSVEKSDFQRFTADKS